LKVRRFIDIHFNIIRVVYPNEVMKRCKCRRDKGLNTHVILRRELEYSKTFLEDPEDPLNNIAG
jgi:hypothetical protein